MCGCLLAGVVWTVQWVSMLGPQVGWQGYKYCGLGATPGLMQETDRQTDRQPGRQPVPYHDEDSGSLSVRQY